MARVLQFVKLDRAAYETRILQALSDGCISVGKACEALTNYAASDTGHEDDFSDDCVPIWDRYENERQANERLRAAMRDLRKFARHYNWCDYASHSGYEYGDDIEALERDHPCNCGAVGAFDVAEEIEPLDGKQTLEVLAWRERQKRLRAAVKDLRLELRAWQRMSPGPHPPTTAALLASTADLEGE